MKNTARCIGLASALLLLSSIFVACRKDGDPARWDVDVLAPLVTTSFTIGDIVPDSLLMVDGAGNVTLLYTSELFSVDLDTVLRAPDTTYTYPGAITVPGPLDLPAGTGIVSENNVTRFDFNEVALSELILREGSVELELTNMITSNVIGTFTLPGAQFPNSGNTISASVAQGSPSSPTIIREVRDLSGVSFDLRGPQYNAVNTLHTVIGINLDPNGQGAVVTDQDSVNASITYRGLKPQYARGYFGSDVYTVEPTETELDLFKNFVSGSLDLDQVALRVKLVNGIGIDLQVVLGYLRAVNTRTGNTVDLSNAIFQGPINLARAIDLGYGFIPTTYTNLLDNSNSNVDLFLENLPDKLSYAMDLRLNPLGDVSNGNDFVYADSKVRAELELEVPLRLIASQLTLQSFVDVDLPKGFQYGDLRFFSTNGFPFSASLVAEVVDENDQPVSSLTVQGNIASGILGSNGLVQTRVDSRLQASVDRAQAQQLKAGGRLRLRVTFDTADQIQHLQILDTYALDLQVTLGANFMVNGE